MFDVWSLVHWCLMFESLMSEFKSHDQFWNMRPRIPHTNDASDRNSLFWMKSTLNCEKNLYKQLHQTEDLCQRSYIKDKTHLIMTSELKLRVSNVDVCREARPWLVPNKQPHIDTVRWRKFSPRLQVGSSFPHSPSATSSVFVFTPLSLLAQMVWLGWRRRRRSKEEKLGRGAHMWVLMLFYVARRRRC